MHGLQVLQVQFLGIQYSILDLEALLILIFLNYSVAVPMFSAL